MKFTIDICPNEVEDDSLEYKNSSKSISVSSSETTIDVTVNLCPYARTCYDRPETVIVKLCPVGGTCGCNYNVDDLSWIEPNTCLSNVSWTNPDKCILREVRLRKYNFWDGPSDKYVHLKSGDPNIIIYPDDDPRNNGQCFGCGIGGAETNPTSLEHVTDDTNLVPGQKYEVLGYFDDLSCGGNTVAVSLAQTVYQTTGFTSGQLLEQLSAAPPKWHVLVYRYGGGGIDPDATSVEAFVVDYTDFEVGDAVMIGKLDTNFPDGGVYGNVQITESEVDQGEEAKYYIIPYNKVTE